MEATNEALEDRLYDVGSALEGWLVDGPIYIERALEIMLFTPT